MSESMHWLEPAFMNAAEIDPTVCLKRWELVRLILEAGERRKISDDEVLSWTPKPDHEITLSELLAGAFPEKASGNAYPDTGARNQ